MSVVEMSVQEGVATVTLVRGKVNAINESVTDELKTIFKQLAASSNVRSVILTGKGRFFSFGLDIPEFLNYSKDSFLRFVRKFADLYTLIFLFPKPVIAGLNGHTIAGGCMLATACDYRVMISGKAKIGLNEINFGSSLFPGSVEMLKNCVGTRNAELIAYSGSMYSAEQAYGMGLVDHVSSDEKLADDTSTKAEELAERYGPAFESIKMMLREDTGARMKQKDDRYLAGIVDIWYSEDTWKKLQQIKITP